MGWPVCSHFVFVDGGIVWPPLVPTGISAGYDSTTEALIGSLTNDLLILGATIALIFEAALLYVIVRYRDSGDARPARYNPRLYVTYLVAVGLILLFVGVASFQTLVAMEQQNPNPPPDDAVEVDVTAVQFLWLFEYPDEDVSTQETMVVPVNETVYLRITSEDVIHSFHAPELGLKADAHPAQWNTLTFTPTNTGEYRVYCAEFCGRAHSTMLGEVRVVDRSAYDEWLEEERGSGGNQSGS